MSIDNLMKQKTIFLLVLFAASVNANNNQQSPIKAQENSVFLNQKMQQCMSLVDMDVIENFTDKGLKLNKTIKLLCKNNKRNDAQSNAVGFAVEIQKSKDLAVFRQCEKIIDQTSSLMRQIMKTYFISDLRYKHICDHSKL